MKTIQFIFLLNLFSFPILALAEVYKWVDENGKVHYGDKPDQFEENYQSVETIKVQDRFVGGQVERKVPITYKGQEMSHPLSVEGFSYENFENSENVFIGNVGYGIGCGKNKPIHVSRDRIVSDDRYLLEVIKNSFLASGYHADINIGSVGGSLLLKPDIKKFKTDICVLKNKNQVGSSAYEFKVSQYIKIKWSLVDDIRGKTLHTIETEGVYKGSEFRDEESLQEYRFEKAVEMASNNLLAEKSFVEHLKSINIQEYSNSLSSEPLKLAIKFAQGASSFNDEVNVLNASAVTIKREYGHGSGVILTKDGYVLTNAHVIGSDTSVQVMVSGKEYPALVERVNVLRDVAILKITNPGRFENSKISQQTPNVGDEVYVIGTPLDLSLSNTITKGIISAKRNRNGLDYYQTDASINSGNSGGPVFNKEGELVAISVAGLFTQGGASLNVNYLIPISDAIEKLGLIPEENNFIHEMAGEDASDRLMDIFDSIMRFFE